MYEYTEKDVCQLKIEGVKYSQLILQGKENQQKH